MIKATAAILTRNSGLSIRKCLESVKLFSEIIVLDGNSTDSTLSICKQYKCKIYSQPKYLKFRNGRLKNFAEARNFLFRNASNNLILFIDSDEYLSQKLLNKIKFLSHVDYLKSSINQFLVCRIGKFENSLLKFSGFIQNYQPRIFFRNKNLKFIKNVHEKLVSSELKIVTKKMKYDEFIKFNYLDTLLKIKNKNYYYFSIEKKFMIKKNSISSISFVFFRILVYGKLLIKTFIIFCFYSNKKFLKLQLYNIFLQIKLSLKLLF